MANMVKSGINLNKCFFASYNFQYPHDSSLLICTRSILAYHTSIVGGISHLIVVIAIIYFNPGKKH